MDMRKLATELVGTFFLVLTVGTAGVVSPGIAPLAIGFALMIMVYMGGHISGGHYNPAVSLAVFIRGKLPFKDLIPYWLAQIIGATAAALIAWMCVKDAPGVTIPKGWGFVHGAITVEILFTFALALVVLNVATDPKTEGNSYYGLAIGGTIVVAAAAGGPVSGGAFNPAVALGMAIPNLFDGARSWQFIWIYLLFPLVGGFLAGMFYKFQHGEAKTEPVIPGVTDKPAARAPPPPPATPPADTLA
ncbi:MAG: MIP/aquaporin family protein [Phycisphaeraceae bacterium]